MDHINNMYPLNSKMKTRNFAVIRSRGKYLVNITVAFYLVNSHQITYGTSNKKFSLILK